MEQGSEEWLRERSKRFTSSRFKDLDGEGRAFVPKKGVEYKDYLYRKEIKIVAKKEKEYLVPLFSSTGFTYIREVVSGRMGSMKPNMESKAMRYGHDTEPLARNEYENKTGILVEEYGLITHPDYDFCGGSPDGCILNELNEIEGIIEIKCPHNPSNHIRYATDLDYVITEHYDQCMGNIWVNNASYCDFISYDPRNELKPIYIHRFHRDEERIAKIQERILLAEQVATAMYNEILNPNCVDF